MKKDDNIITGSVTFFGALIGLFIVAAIQAFVVMKYYDWFMYPVINVELPYSPFLAFSLLYHYLRIDYNNRVEKVQSFGLVQLIQAIMLPLVYLGIGFILYILR